ncbi:MAG: D-alanyl-D-alanine carboxypeptidase [Prochlorococcus sp. SP3034]|nr:D-alanyl-D-alanine carboxypeptidase [Prochlorococcus sp. SP3034]|tara:strand:- start:4864 stop:6081 length:1218 start_codon:yes stop_codon:yes gene_type:complete
MLKNFRKIFIFSLPVLFFILMFRDLIKNRSIKIINEIYFQLPLLLNSKKICNNYQDLLKKSLNYTYSATIINDKGIIIGSYNDNKPRIPASNLKLLSTAYTLNKYKVTDKLNTSIYKDKLNNYYLIGSGDPDLSLYEIKKLINKINYDKLSQFNIVEIGSDTKWPVGWTEFDKLYMYGSPITSLAINSNQSRSIDIFYIKRIIENHIKNNYPLNNIEVSILEYNNNIKKNLKLIYEIPSNPILSLITLANSESHNFTAEVLFKNASKSWNYEKYEDIKLWLRRIGLPVNDISIKDASGLSRNNRLTTNLIALFLHKMRFSKNFEFYNSSLSIISKRGTLSNKMKNSSVSGRFFGKTGTLSNVFALSGYLYKDNEVLSISIIQNSENVDINIFFKLLDDIYKLKKC